MTWDTTGDDEIMAEVRKIKADFAKRFDYDLDKMFADLQQWQRESGLEFVNSPSRKSASARERDEDIADPSVRDPNS